MPYVQHTQCVKPDDHVGLAPGLIVTAIVQSRCSWSVSAGA